MDVRRQLVTSLDKTWGTGSAKSSITIHETANTSRGADAAAHANLQSSGNVRQASWHWQVDDTEAVQSFEHGVRCWHAGSAAADSIAIEICVNRDGDYLRALGNAAALVVMIRAQEGGIPVVDHHSWTGKDCPARLRAGTSGMTWDEFIELTTEDTVEPQDVWSYRLSPAGSGGEMTKEQRAAWVVKQTLRHAAEASAHAKEATEAVAELRATIDAALAELRRLRITATITTET